MGRVLAAFSLGCPNRLDEVAELAGKGVSAVIRLMNRREKTEEEEETCRKYTSRKASP
jgi:hypothetical protein